jgi:copper transport protein
MEPMRRRLGVPALLGLFALLVSPALPGQAGGVYAHAQLVAATPGAGEVLDAAPAEIRLIFSEPIEGAGTSVDLADDDGALIAERVGDVDPEDPYALVFEPPTLSDGVFTVTWRTLSAADGHAAEGFFSFGIGDAVVPDGSSGSTTHEAPGVVDILGRWVTYAGFLLAIGAAAFNMIVLRAPLTRHATRILAVALAAGAAASLALALDAGLASGAPGAYLGTRNGLLQLARASIAALGAIALLVVPARAIGIAAVAGVTGVAVHVASGHAAALPTPIPLVAQVVHVAAAGVWVGGIAMLLALLVRPGWIVDDPGRPRLPTLVPRLSALGLTSIALVGGAGLYLAWVEAGSLFPVDSEYGRVLIVKTVVFVAAASLGALNYLDGGRLRAWLGGLRPRLTAETAGAAGVLLATAFLASTPPPGPARGVAIEPIPDAFGTVAPNMRMEITPGRPGVNRILVITDDLLAALPGLELGLDRVDAGTSSLVPLVLDSSTGSTGGGGGHAHGGASSGTALWIADAIVLPTGSAWDTSVRLLTSDGSVAGRQRFAFTMASDGIAAGRDVELLSPALGIAVLMAVGGAVGLGLTAGGASLPRCDPRASRLALGAASGIGFVLGIAIGTEHLVTVI